MERLSTLMEIFSFYLENAELKSLKKFILQHWSIALGIMLVQVLS